jgi:hypothetical protein
MPLLLRQRIPSIDIAICISTFIDVKKRYYWVLVYGPKALACGFFLSIRYGLAALQNTRMEYGLHQTPPKKPNLSP